MDKARLLTLLEQLHAELATADELDDETKSAVAALAADAQRLLKDEAAVETARKEASGPATLAEQFRERMREFSADHPQIAKALNQVADGLSGLGI